MEIEEKICNAIQGQINEFYLQRPNIHNKGMVTCILTDDLYSKRLELAKSQKERRLTIESKKDLDNFNGSILPGRTRNDVVTALISTKAFQWDAYTWLGTIHHEFTHAHDFLDIADYLEIYEMDGIYDYQFYWPFQWWSEFHARDAGLQNVYRFLYEKSDSSIIESICREIIPKICHQLKSSQNPYTAMQCYGRYSALLELYENKIPSFKIAGKKFGVPDSMIQIGEFLIANREFSSICDKFSTLQDLVNRV